MIEVQEFRKDSFSTGFRKDSLTVQVMFLRGVWYKIIAWGGVVADYTFS